MKTLPKREIICGYGEILKHSLIKNKNFFKYLNKNINKILNLSSPFIEKLFMKVVKLKRLLLKKMKKRKNLEKFKFYHTFACYEACLNYSQKLNHGKAVILGIQTALNFSLSVNLLNKKDHNIITEHISNSYCYQIE